MKTVYLFVATAYIFAASVSAACAGGNIITGERVARESCAICHNVEKNGPFKQSPPSFAAIAVYRSDNQIRNRIFYPDAHTGMRSQLGFVFSIDKIENLVAFIRSLESQMTPSPSGR